MDFEELVGLGFSINESKVYLALARYNKADANQIIKAIKFHKKIVYENLEKLIDKGLVNFIVERGRRVYSLNSPEIIIQNIDDEAKLIEQKRRKAIAISKEIVKIKKQNTHKQIASVYRGSKGIRSFYQELLKGGDYVVFGAPSESMKIMGEVFWNSLIRKMQDKNIKAKLLFNESIRGYGQRIKNKQLQVKFLEKEFESLTETNIQGGKVAIIVWTKEPMLFLIEDMDVAKSYKKYFNVLWKQAKL